MYRWGFSDEGVSIEVMDQEVGLLSLGSLRLAYAGYARKNSWSGLFCGSGSSERSSVAGACKQLSYKRYQLSFAV